MDVCRICLCACGECESSVALAEFLDCEKKIHFLDAYKECTHLEALWEDIMCENCVKELKACYEFIQKAKQSDAKLRLHLHSMFEAEAEAEQEIYGGVDPLSGNNAENADAVALSASASTSHVDEEKMKMQAEEFISIKIEQDDKICPANVQKVSIQGDGDDVSNYKVDDAGRRSTQRKRKHSTDEEWPCGESDKEISFYSDPAECTEKIENLNFYCKRCGMGFDTEYKRSYHRKTGCGKKNFECSICHKFYCTLYSLKCHMHVHPEQRPFECTICGEKFAAPHQLKTHILKHRDRELRFTCKLCGKAYSIRKSYVNHMNSVHGHKQREGNAESSFSCDFCPRDYKSECRLLLHLEKQHPGQSTRGSETELAANQRPLDEDASEDSKQASSSKRNELCENEAISLSNYICGTCPETFTTIEELREHSRTHEGDRPFHCEICGATFARWTAFQDHKQLHNNETYKCNICEKKLSTRHSLIKHMRYHNPKPLSCPACDKKYVRPFELTRHLISHKGDKPFPCELCEWGFLRKEILDEHNKRHHQGQANDSPVDTFAQESESHLEIEGIWCHRIDECGPSAVHASKNKTDKQQTNSDMVVKCQDEKEAGLNSEQDKPKMKFPCEKCGKELLSLSTLRKHKFEQCGQKNFLCTMCPKSFCTIGRLKNHTRIHTGERPFVCKCCGKSFTQSTSLDYHIRIHTGERPYKCKTCEKKFAQHSTMMMHIKTMHMPKKFACHICEKKFVRIHELNKHMRVHTGERPHVCNYCPKNYTSTAGLKLHMNQYHIDKFAEEERRKTEEQGE